VIVDAHTHCWSRPGDLIREMDSAGVDAAVVVSAALDGHRDNNEYVAAAGTGRLRQFADVDSRWSDSYHRPGAAARLAAVADRFFPAGVSHYLNDHNDGWLVSAEGRAFFAEASRRGLPVSLAATPGWFDDICAVAATIPDTPVLLNHLARGPGIIKPGAAHQNLVVKVSGYYYGSDRPFPFPDQLELVRAFYETWGPHRMVWGSDYPACEPHISYRQSLEVISEHADFIAPADRPLILGATMSALLPG
jgi:L-fuconolactonase